MQSEESDVGEIADEERSVGAGCDQRVEQRSFSKGKQCIGDIKRKPCCSSRERWSGGQVFWCWKVKRIFRVRA